MFMWLLDIVKRTPPFGSIESKTWTHQQRSCLQIWASILNCIKNIKRLDTPAVLNSETFDNVA